MQTPPSSTSTGLEKTFKPTPPGILFVALIALAIITVLGFFAAIARGSVYGFVAVGCNLALILGLLLGHRWAYVLVILFAGVGVVVAFSKGFAPGLLALLGNGLVVVPMVLSTGYFFSPDATEEKSGPP
jgi:hypothetical protein